MPISNLPEFNPREILVAGKLNLLVQAISAKFSAVTGADLTWPLITQGDIDFNSQDSIISLRTFWNIINAAEYDTLQLAIDAAESGGGGCVFIPPGPPIPSTTADGVDIEASDILIMGAGKDSILTLTSGSSSGYLLRTGAGSLSNIGIMNLTLDGQSTGSGQKGIIARRVNQFIIQDVDIKNFTGDFIQITNDGTPGNSSVDGRIINVRCTGGSADHIISDDIDGLTIDNLISRSASSDGIAFEPGGAGGILRDISISNSRFNDPGGKGISILSASGTASDNWSRILVSDCIVYNSSGDSYELGEASKILKWLNVRDCMAIAAGADAFVVNSDGGAITGCHGPSATGTGIDMVASEDFVVAGNFVSNAGANGIDASDTVTCTVRGNDVEGAFTEGIRRDSATGLISGENFGDHGTAIGTSHAERVDGSHTGNTTETTVKTFTIPGNTILRAGDGLRIQIAVDLAVAGGIATYRTKVDGNEIATFGLNAVTSAAGVAHIILNSAGGNSDSWNYGFGTNVISTRTADSIDWTADVNVIVTIQLTDAGDTGTLYGFLVEYIGGQPA